MKAARGFTLLEIMIAMVLVSLVVLIVGQALGIAIDAWERGGRQAEALQIRQSIPVLLGRQLQAVVADNLFDPALGDFRQHFCAEPGHLSFLTTYAPLGIPLQGLQRITYRYSEADQRLEIFQQVITHADDLDDASDASADQWHDELEPLSRFEQVTAFALWFTAETAFETDNEDHWQQEWACGKTLPDSEHSGIPQAVMLYIEAARPAQPSPPRWLLAVGW